MLLNRINREEGFILKREVVVPIIPTLRVTYFYVDADESAGHLSQYFPAAPYEEIFVLTELLQSEPLPVNIVKGKEKAIDEIDRWLALGDYLVERID